MMVDQLKIINNHIDGIVNVLKYIQRGEANNLIKITNLLADAAVTNIPVYTAGNGACAALSEHWACDHSKGASTNMFSNRVISLSSNMPLITAIGNDISFDKIFSFQLSKLTDIHSHGVVVLLSASGSSINIIDAAKFIKTHRPFMKVVSVTGFRGEPLKSLSDLNVHIDLHEYEGVEDVQSAIMHMLAKLLKNKLEEMSQLVK